MTNHDEEAIRVKVCFRNLLMPAIYSIEKRRAESMLLCIIGDESLS